MLGSRSSSNPLHSIGSSACRLAGVANDGHAARRGRAKNSSPNQFPADSTGELEEREQQTMGRSTATLHPQSRPKLSTRVEARPKEGYRDTVEAIVVALILALVVRGFEAQAFVIPTGSMAPTLMGRHKEIDCPQCGFRYAVNASEEVDVRSPGRNVYAGLCVNCRYQARLDEEPSFKGDRILVMMFPYDLPFLPGSSPPERWDVVVFRYPEEPEVSYIKRLIGLPGETLRILHGDVYIKQPGSDAFILARKPLRHQTAMQIGVYDDRHRPRAFTDRSEWRRWRSWSGDWHALDPSQSRYQTEGEPKDQWSELRYHHLVPDPEQWDAILNDRELPRPPRATLITDFYSYNTNMPEESSNLLGEPYGDQEGAWMQPHWVGDLSLEADLEVSQIARGGSVRFELIKAGIPHRCTIDLTSGMAIISRGDDLLSQCETPIKGTGRYHVAFANVDDRMSLAVNGRAVRAQGFDYEVGEAIPIPTAADLAPAAIAARNAVVVANDLVLKRDIYYTQYPGRIDYRDVWEDRYPRTPADLFDFLSDPARFSRLVHVGFHDFEIGPDRFFMLGDNSPRSKDSRGWDTEDSRWNSTDRKAWEVPRQLLTGKAFYVYWPHGVPFGPQFLRFTRDIRFIFRPYWERMKWIR
jgi:signal peptidase I